ncbi:WD40 repeat-like protein [Fragilariopsis cylindrus CCMP1102]|uniref:WD40 repeat-like protein n=1 Tax=Fragilariopsis cylindrus CCMP1102 TaxID=635003 RepID=A0A1E7F7A4_9STRA|nr:WD40 repeat-like protein [Fragilariopsis cylindrus CCMP1102]|eukprot:OEU13994.1 WD40 repeat-like protein [Fragilariopsis cylindrus CCMP1102]
MSWDPHHADIIAYSTGDTVHLVDWREAPTNESSSSIISENNNSNYLNGYPHHRYGITDLDYNPNKPNIIVTSGKDGLLKFWDLRKTAKQRPILVARGGHRHWTTCVSYNPFHDQLVLSAGSDSLVNLWRMSTISSAPLLTFDDEQQLNNSNNNARHVSRYEHMDSVNAIAWGAADAWIYMSASFDGKVVLNHVPSKEKYKILL